MRVLLRIALIAACLFAGWLIGTSTGVIVGVAWDRTTGNDWVSNALLTIPVFGFLGTVVMLFVGWRLTRPR